MNFTFFRVSIIHVNFKYFLQFIVSTLNIFYNLSWLNIVIFYGVPRWSSCLILKSGRIYVIAPCMMNRFFLVNIYTLSGVDIILSTHASHWDLYKISIYVLVRSSSLNVRTNVLEEYWSEYFGEYIYIKQYYT